MSTNNPEHTQSATTYNLFDLSDFKTRQAWIICTGVMFISILSAIKVLENLTHLDLLSIDDLLSQLSILCCSARVFPTLCVLVVIIRNIQEKAIYKAQIHHHDMPTVE